MAVQAVIVRKCQSQQTWVTPRQDGGGLLEFRGGMQNASNLTSHTPSQFYQGSCWSAATVRCINHLSCSLSASDVCEREEMVQKIFMCTGVKSPCLSCCLCPSCWEIRWSFGVNRRLLCCKRRAVCCNSSRFCSKSDVCVVDADLKW